MDNSAGEEDPRILYEASGVVVVLDFRHVPLVTPNLRNGVHKDMCDYA